MSGPLRLPIQLPPQPRWMLHNAPVPATTLLLDVVDGNTYYLTTENEELVWRKVRKEDDGEQQRESEQEDDSSQL